MLKVVQEDSAKFKGFKIHIVINVKSKNSKLLIHKLKSVSALGDTILISWMIPANLAHMIAILAILLADASHVIIKCFKQKEP